MTHANQRPLPRILVCSSDHGRLSSLLESHGALRDSELLQQLDAELARAEIVAPELLGRDVVRMNSVVQFRDLDSGARRVYQLVYPHDADLERGRVSILAPVGCALLGLSVGQKIAWPLPAGRTRNLEVVSVAQPSGEQGMTPVADPACVAS